jgi:hypothetical protein
MHPLSLEYGRHPITTISAHARQRSGIGRSPYHVDRWPAWWTAAHPLSTIADETVAIAGQKPDYDPRRTGKPENAS